MPKPTKTNAGAATPAAKQPETQTNSTTPVGGIDLSKLTPEQLAALQKQLKQSKRVSKDDHTKRFALIDEMLKEKYTTEDEKEEKIPEGSKVGDFKHTTRDIINALDADGLIKDKVDENWDQIEIKKVQARKQFLEKKRDEKGNLVFPANTFGYKQSAGTGFSMTPVRVVTWFADEANVTKLSTEQRADIFKAMGAK